MSERTEFVQLPKRIGQSLITDASCEGVITYCETDRETIRLQSPDNTTPAASEDYVAVYRVGEGYIIGEFSAADETEFLAIEKTNLLAYFEHVFSEYIWITEDHDGNAWWSSKVCCL